jgi:rRNA processing protein Gar1
VDSAETLRDVDVAEVVVVSCWYNQITLISCFAQEDFVGAEVDISETLDLPTLFWVRAIVLSHFNAINTGALIEMGSFIHAVEDEMLCSSLMADKVPYFNAPIYLQNKSVIGKVDEILGPINEVYFSIKMGEGMVASSFKKGDKVYIGGDKLLPIERFLPKPKIAGKGAFGLLRKKYIILANIALDYSGK